VKAKVQNVFGEADKVTVEWVLLGGEGVKKFEIPCANIYDFKDGKIKGVRMHFDSAYFADIIGGK
jgi:ketosteroid isomerase-like protein